MNSMTDRLQTTNKKITEKLNGLRTTQTTKDLLQGLREQKKVDKTLLVLLDTSGSMNDALGFQSIPDRPKPNQFGPAQPVPHQSVPHQTTPYQTKIEVAWATFQSELLPNMARWSYGIIGFNNEAYWISYPMQTTQLATLAPYAMGSTSMGQALQFVWVWIRNHAKEARIILLSDGMPTDMSREAILVMARENADIPIDTVGVGTVGRGYDPVLLQKLSEITGGTFQSVGSVAQLIDTMKKLSPQERPLLGRVKEAPDGAGK